MSIKRSALSAIAAISSVVCGGCQAPVEPALISSSIESVSLVELPSPRVGKGLQVSVRLAEAEGTSVELLQCTVSLQKFDGERWGTVDGDFCPLSAGAELRAYPIVDGKLTLVFVAPGAAGQYRVSGGVRRTGRNELISFSAQFELSAEQIRP